MVACYIFSFPFQNTKAKPLFKGLPLLQVAVNPIITEWMAIKPDILCASEKQEACSGGISAGRLWCLGRLDLGCGRSWPWAAENNWLLSVHLLPLGRPVSACTRWSGCLHPPAFMPQLVRNSHLTCLRRKKSLLILRKNNETLSDEKSDIWKSKKCHGPLINDTLPSFKPHPTTPTPVSKPLPPTSSLEKCKS